MYESRYTDIVAYENYLLDLELQQEEMNRYLSECVLLSSPDKKRAIQEMAVLNEGTIGDKFKKAWARIKSFFTKIYQKFLESLQAWANDNTAYLKQYANIIFEKKCTLQSVKMQDHFEGLKNFDKLKAHTKDVFSKIPDVEHLADIGNRALSTKADTSDKTTENQSKAVDAYTIEQQTKVAEILGDKSLVEPDDTSGFAGRVRNWLNGGENVEEYSGSTLEGNNMEYMYNFLYKYDALVESLKKIKDAFDSGMNGIETAYKKGFENMKNSVKNSSASDVKAAFKDSESANPNSALGKELKKANDDLSHVKDEAKTESTSYYSTVYNTILTEAEIKSGSNGGDTNSGTVKGDPSYDAKHDQALTDANRKERKDASTTASDTKSAASERKTNAGGAGAFDAAMAKGSGISNDDLYKYEDTALSMIRAWGNTRSLVMGAALNSLSDTRKDFFDVIRAHVRSWVGQTEGPDQNTDTKPTNTTNTHK